MRVVYGHFSCASALSFTTRSVFTTVGQFFHLLTFQKPISFQDLTDRGRLKRPLLYLTVVAKSSHFFVTLTTFPTYPVHK